MGMEYFLKLDGINGDSKDKDHVYEIDVLSWGPQDVALGGMRSTGRFSILKTPDSATPAVMQYYLKGRDIPRGQLTCRVASSRLEFLRIWFEDLLVESMRTLPMQEFTTSESWDFVFAKVYAEFRDGSGQVVREIGWNVRGNRKL